MSEVYVVGYDLNKPGQNYAGLMEELKKSPSWWHYLDSTWLIYTKESATQLRDRILNCVDNSDRLLVMEVTKNYSGWLPQEAWTWISNHLI
ncbi:hypothetical protein [Mucilaginibacter ginkgonis]|uniref:SinR family protein n=1 Tax=Mucilaginibacter ginkgonis TaxID=2682091 RepID=A0A6I4I0A9_9SPHI|nr:hypothetical protein [Mucilaginibacter ginkgonis]QQL51003.1 SinR family protein [Mucilaginibacter ginkgonis]